MKSSPNQPNQNPNQSVIDRELDSTEDVKGINLAPHIHEHLRHTIMATALRIPSRITSSRLSTLR